MWIQSGWETLLTVLGVLSEQRQMTHRLLYIERLSRYSVFLVKCSLRLIYAVHGYHEILRFAAPRILLPRSTGLLRKVRSTHRLLARSGLSNCPPNSNRIPWRSGNEKVRGRLDVLLIIWLNSSISARQASQAARTIVLDSVYTGYTIRSCLYDVFGWPEN